jgi:DNA repair protein RadC
MENLTIKTWAEDDRPREKLLEKGRHVLSEAELIAILIGSGNREETAVGLAQRILSGSGNDLRNLAKLGVADLTKFKGIGEAKAIAIIAALELGRRRKDSETNVQEKIISSGDAFKQVKPVFMDLLHEEFWILLLSRSNHLIRREFISRGGVSGTLVDPKMVFKPALQYLASSMILCHNHPSGNLKPSEADLKITNQLREAGKSLEIPVLDHIIADNSLI